MKWSRDFTHLLLTFAYRVSTVEGVSLDEALLKGTPLYPNFNLGTDFDASSPLWQEFLRGIQEAEDRLAWTHHFYCAHARQYTPKRYGCFDFYYDAQTHNAGLHFGNLDTSGHGPLSAARRPVRTLELQAMFEDIHRLHPEVETFSGSSWLYNLSSYQVLFPPTYIATATSIRPRFTFFDVWGQFLDHDWNLRRDRAESFLANIEAAETYANLEASFPLQPLAVKGPIQDFYEFHGIG